MDWGNLLFSFEGRINRAKYWIGILILIAIMVFISIILVATMGLTFISIDFTGRLILFVVQLAFLYPSTALMVKRFHDRNRPSWFAAIIIVPLLLQGLLGLTGDPMNPGALSSMLGLVILAISIWFFIELGCLRGTIGPNQYGPDPLEGRA